MKATDACPCGSGRRLGDCCARLHAGLPAPTAEALMRSRYSAFVLGLETYLLQTWHPSTRPAELNLTDDVATKWLGLNVQRHQILDDQHAIVEFVARYRIAGRGHRLHETSRFVRDDGGWRYVDGDIHSQEKNPA